MAEYSGLKRALIMSDLRAAESAEAVNMSEPSAAFCKKVNKLIDRYHNPLWKYVNTAGKKAAAVFAAVILCAAAVCVKTMFTKEKPPQGMSGLIMRYSFEESLDHATDVVCGEYIESGEYANNVLHYFAVKARVYGNAPDVITVIADNNVYEKGKNYLLILFDDNFAEAYRKILTYQVLGGIFIDLEDPAGALMYGEPIALRAKELDFSKDGIESIIAYIAERTSDNVREGEVWYGCIYSDSAAEIIAGSPEVIKVKVDSTGSILRGDLHDIDEMNCTVTEVYKGDLKPGATVTVSFFPDTAKIGKEYVVAVKVINPVVMRPLCIFTSPGSLITGFTEDEIRGMVSAASGE